MVFTPFFFFDKLQILSKRGKCKETISKWLSLFKQKDSLVVRDNFAVT